MDGYTPVYERTLTESRLCDGLFWPRVFCDVSFLKWLYSKSH